MGWTTPKFSREEVNKAARSLLKLIDATGAGSSKFDYQEWQRAFETVGNWRSSHSWPLNTFKVWLLKKATYVDKDCLVAQRLKRMPSIINKLRRFPQMKFSQMQDIAGCRSIVSSVGYVNQLVNVYKRSDLKHKLVHEDDYILIPKDSGYRGVHLIYSYNSDRSATYNGLKVEVQLRSVYQHAWATAVETVGLFTQQALKSSQGQHDWLRFFQLMSTAIAIREKSPTIPNTPTARKELQNELRQYEARLDVENHLKLFTEALQVPERSGDVQDAHYFLLELVGLPAKLDVQGLRV